MGNSACHGHGDAGVDRELAVLGKESRWCSAGDEIADNVSIKDVMTSVDAGLTTTWFDVCRLESRWEVAGRAHLRRLCLDLGFKAVLAEVLCGITGPADGSDMANRLAGSKRRQDQRMVACQGGR